MGRNIDELLLSGGHGFCVCLLAELAVGLGLGEIGIGDVQIVLGAGDRRVDFVGIEFKGADRLWKLLAPGGDDVGDDEVIVIAAGAEADLEGLDGLENAFEVEGEVEISAMYDCEIARIGGRPDSSWAKSWGAGDVRAVRPAAQADAAIPKARAEVASNYSKGIDLAILFSLPAFEAE